jgi:glycosyltransferase involved in cell wall biosynthesis
MSRSSVGVPRRTLSVVIATVVGPPFIDDCLASLEQQAKTLGADVLVVTRGPSENTSRLQQRYPWVRVILGAELETIPALRRRGVQHAAGDIVAIIEEHCVADPRWLHEALATHSFGDYAAVGGPVVDDGYGRLRDWAVYFCEYNAHMPPAPSSDVVDLNGANIAYRRAVLAEHSARLGEGYWEASLHPVLLGLGATFRSAPQMVVRHRGPFDLGYYLRQRYWFSRAFAGARSETMPWSTRLLYLVAGPLVPFVLFARMATRVWRKRCHVLKFAMTVPLVIPALAVLVAGEWVGYLVGPGNALAKVE